MAGGLDGNIAFLAVLARAVGIGVVLAAGGALIVRQVAILVAGGGGISVLCKLGMLACILCDLGITAACILGFEVCILKVCIALIAEPVFKITLLRAGGIGVFLVRHLVGGVIVCIGLALKLEARERGGQSACLVLKDISALIARPILGHASCAAGAGGGLMVGQRHFVCRELC